MDTDPPTVLPPPTSAPSTHTYQRSSSQAAEGVQEHVLEAPITISQRELLAVSPELRTLIRRIVAISFPSPPVSHFVFRRHLRALASRRCLLQRQQWQQQQHANGTISMCYPLLTTGLFSFRRVGRRQFKIHTNCLKKMCPVHLPSCQSTFISLHCTLSPRTRHNPVCSRWLYL